MAMNFQQELEELREEANGSRAGYYEQYGSAIAPALLPLADLLEASHATHPVLAEAALEALRPWR